MGKLMNENDVDMRAFIIDWNTGKVTVDSGRDLFERNSLPDVPIVDRPNPRYVEPNNE